MHFPIFVSNVDFLGLILVNENVSLITTNALVFSVIIVFH